MKALKRISVLMPCYNAASYVGAAIDSVLHQDFPEVEIVAVDDESSDGSTEILASYENRGVKVIAQKNSGAAVARNTAFAASTGDAVLFMDCDDIISASHLSLLATSITNSRTIAMGEWDRFYFHPGEAQFPFRATYRDAPGVDWLISGGWGMMQPAIFLLPRELIEECGLWNPMRSPNDDFEFFTRTISRSDGVRFAENARLYYRSGLSGSLSSCESRSHIEGVFNSLMLGTKHLLAVEDTLRTRRAAANVLKTFDYKYYPLHQDLRKRICAQIAELGGADAPPSGSPRFQKLRRFVGWRLATHVQRALRR